MAWIELHQAVWTHRKTLLLAAELELPETYAAGHVIRLWCWALDNTPDGDLTSLPARVIAFGADWRGDPAAFLDALIQAGWVDADEDGRMCLHDWDEYAGRLVDRRRQDADRKRAWRDARGASIEDVTRTGRGPGAGHPPDVRRTVPNPTGPDRTQPDRTQPETRTRAANAVAPPREEPPARVKNAKPTGGLALVTDEWIEEQVAVFGPQLGGEHRARDAIALALGHKARKKHDDPRLYIVNWLRRDADRYQQEHRSNGATRSGLGRELRPGENADEIAALSKLG